jgi:predicted aconitase with swiveling domain
MADVQIAVIDTTENQVNVAVPGVQGPIGSVAIAQDGTATEPGIRFESDTNTGIYRPGADQLAISTNAVERVEFGTSEVVFNDGGTNYDFRIEGDTNANLLFVDASTDRVGIGTTSPNSALSIDGASNLGSLGSGAPVITLKNTDTTDFNAAQIVNRDSGGNIAGGISFRNNSHGASGSSEVLLWTRNAGTVRASLTVNAAGTMTVDSAASTAPFIAQINSSEVARIDSSGRLLVGTSTARNTGDFRFFQIEGTTSSTAGASVLRNSNDNVGSRFVLGKSRGTTIGSNTVVLQNDTLGVIAFNGADGSAVATAAAAIEAQVDGTPGTNDMPGRLVFSTTADGAATPTERLRITSAGNVGIGTTSPATTLDVNGDVTIADKIIHGSDTNTAIRFPAADTVSVETGGSERARIDSSGRLLVGTSTNITDASNGVRAIQSAGSSPSIGTHRNDNTIFGSGLLITKARGTAFEVLQANDTIGLVRFDGANGTSFNIAAEIQCQVDAIPGADDMPARLVFLTTADGAATPTERLRITSAGVLQVADAGNIQVGTTTGTKIGTATTQKLGFYDATPVVQPTAVADATDAATVITQLNALLTRMRNLGLIAT